MGAVMTSTPNDTKEQGEGLSSSLIVSFHDACWASILITTRYNIYVIIEQLVSLAEPLV